MDIKITKALIIDEPWITKILNGEKDWEMRSSSSRIRGPIGLIRKGSLQVVGIADFSHVSGPYDNDSLIENTYHHCIPSERFSQPDYKWRYAWELKGAKPLPEPVRYVHKNGAVIWVELDEQAVESIARQLHGLSDAYLNTASKQPESTTVETAPILHSDESVNLNESNKNQSVEEYSSSDLKEFVGLKLVPKAKDGSVFSAETCNNKGIYTVGNKGDEQKFRSFEDALDYLESMPVARWRRPNANGNFGIVTAVSWVTMMD